MHKLYSTASNGKDFRDIVRCFDHLSIQGDVLSDEVFEITKEVFRNEILYNKNRMSDLVVAIYHNFYKMTDFQKNTLLGIIRKYYSLYENLEFCWSVGDLLARQYDANEAISLFGELICNASKNGAEGIMLGLDVLRRNSQDNDTLRTKIEIVMGRSGGASIS
jgi:hypothetical protein